MVEAAIIYPTVLLLTLGMIVAGLGISRYQEVAYQARQAARWASVQAGTPTPAQVLGQGITPQLLQSDKLSATVSRVKINSVDYISVTLKYRWAPEAFPGILAPVTLTSTSKQPINP